MKSNEAVLTIAIPTYNRLKYLKELLPNVIEQVNNVDGSPALIEILISDNASTDTTGEYVKTASGAEISYYRNDVNIGGDRNFIECIRKAKGKYVWLFGDDEILLDNALRTILDIIARFKPDLITVGSGKFGNITHSQSFTGYEEFLNYVLKAQPNYLIANTLITSNVFARKIFDLDRANRYLETNYGHVYAITKNMKNSGSVYLSTDAVFRVRDQRAPFATKLRNLRFKLVAYLWELGKIYKDTSAKHYCHKFLVECIIDDIFFKLPRRILSNDGYLKYVDVMRQCYRFVKGKR